MSARSAAALALLALLQFPALAGEDQTARVASALAALDAARMDETWRFTMTVQLDDELRVVSHDPTRGGYETRQLVSIDSEPPGDDALAAFRKEEKKRIDERDPETASYSYLVDLQSLNLTEARDGRLYFGFAPRVRDLEDELDKLRGELVLDDASGHIEQLAITNAADLSPAFSVTVEHYRLAFHFRQEQDTRLLSRMTSEARGKAGFFKGFDSNVQVGFDAYERVEPVCC